MDAGGRDNRWTASLCTCRVAYEYIIILIECIVVVVKAFRHTMSGDLIIIIISSLLSLS